MVMYMVTFIFISHAHNAYEDPYSRPYLYPYSIVRELLNAYKFPGDTIEIVKGSALAAASGGDPKLGKEAILALMEAVEKSIPTPSREVG